MAQFRQPVKQLMRQGKIQDVQETDPVSRAIQLLDDCNVSALPVRGSDGKYSGVITTTDIASKKFVRLLKAKLNPDQILVLEVMNKTAPLYVMETDSIQQAISLMHKRHIHRLFVADQDFQLVGVISTTDIIRLLMMG